MFMVCVGGAAVVLLTVAAGTVLAITVVVCGGCGVL